MLCTSGVLSLCDRNKYLKSSFVSVKKNNQLPYWLVGFHLSVISVCRMCRMTTTRKDAQNTCESVSELCIQYWMYFHFSFGIYLCVSILFVCVCMCDLVEGLM